MLVPTTVSAEPTGGYRTRGKRLHATGGGFCVAWYFTTQPLQEIPTRNVSGTASVSPTLQPA